MLLESSVSSINSNLNTAVTESNDALMTYRENSYNFLYNNLVESSDTLSKFNKEKLDKRKKNQIFNLNAYLFKQKLGENLSKKGENYEDFDVKSYIKNIKNDGDLVEFLTLVLFKRDREIKAIIEKNECKISGISINNNADCIDKYTNNSQNVILELLQEDNKYIDAFIYDRNNIGFIIRTIKQMIDGRTLDFAYILIMSNLIVYDEDIYENFDKEINHVKLLQILYEKLCVQLNTLCDQCEIIDVFLYYLYAILYRLEPEFLGKYSEFLDVTINLLKYIKNSQNNNGNSNISQYMTDIYDILILYSISSKFNVKFQENYLLIFENFSGEHIEHTLSIINNLFKQKEISAQFIGNFLYEKDSNLMQIIVDFLVNFSKNSIKDAKVGNLCVQILISISYYEQFSSILLENELFFSSIFSIYSILLSSDIYNKNLSSDLMEIKCGFLELTANFIKNRSEFFIHKISEKKTSKLLYNRIKIFAESKKYNVDECIGFVRILNNLGVYYKKIGKYGCVYSNIYGADVGVNVWKIWNGSKNKVLRKNCKFFIDNFSGGVAGFINGLENLGIT